MWHDIYTDILQSKINESKKQVDYIKKSQHTFKKSITEYKKPFEFIKNEYPFVNILDVEVYETRKNILDQVGIKYAAGIFFPYSKTVVLVRQKDLNSTAFSSEKLSSFEKLLSDHTFNNALQIDDVAVHEFLHAVSQKCRPILSNYASQEEQFVYTNSVKYFRQQGLSDKDIILKQFLPNCINDILSSGESIKNIVNSIIDKHPKYKSFSYHDMIEEIPKTLVDCVVNKAIENAENMIDDYDKHGIKVLTDNHNIINVSRASLINFD